MDYSDQKIRSQVVAGLRAEPWQIEMEEIDYGEKLGVFYRSKDGVKRAVTETRGKTEDQIAFALLSLLMNKPEIVPASPISAASIYEGKAGRHPDNCTCSKHRAAHATR